MDNSLQFDPKDYYEKELKDKIIENASLYFDDLVKQSNVDVEASRNKVKELNKAIEIDKANEKVLAKFIMFKTLFIVLLVAGIVGLVFGILFLVTRNNFINTKIYNAIFYGGISLVIVGPILSTISAILLFTKLNKKVKELRHIDEKNNKIVNKLTSEAVALLSSLCSSFDFYDFNKIVKKTTDIFTLDDYLDYEKLALLRLGYGLNSEPTKKESVVAVTSGDIKTNPFIRLKVFEQVDSMKTYVGTKLITWTERVSDGNGGTRTITRSQTLSATVTKFYPEYANASYTIYANEAAPDLIFSRQPSGIKDDANEKEVDKYVNKKEKKLDRLSAKSIKQGGNLTFMANSKFETLFGAINRNNETQYRLLFTPLAQQNMCEVILDNPYGDDFSFFKRNKINIVSSLHGRQIFEFNPETYLGSYDIDELKKEFVLTISEIFKSIYFEMAPVLAIPLYQTTEGGKYDIKRELDQILSDFEAEAFVNSMNKGVFKPNSCATEQILKIKYDSTSDNMDTYEVLSTGFRASHLTDYVSVLGGDGRLHSVPVHYVEYNPVSKVSKVKVGVSCDIKKEEQDLSSISHHKVFYGGLIK